MIRYLVAVGAFELAIFIHIILFNLRLADLGYHENTMGWLAAAMTAATLAAALPAAALARRWGLKPVILTAIIGMGLSLAARAVVTSVPALVLASALVGLFNSMHNVTNPPAIAALAPEQHRSKAFSGNIALAMGVGSLGGVLAGWLPGLLHSKLAALLVAAAVPAVAFAAVAGLRLDAAAPAEQRNETTPGSRRFLLHYVLAVAPWYAFMAGVFPFFNVYLSRVHHASTAAIGGTFAAAQLLQALAVLSMGWWIARLGLVRSVLLSQLLTSLAVLAFLAAGSLSAAGVIYMVYVSLMVMPEPALQNLLMDRVAQSERTMAAAVNEMLALGTNVLVVAGAGWLITRAGYSTLFMALFGMGLAAMAAFYAALGRKTAP